MKLKIISGGQYGADIAGLRAGKVCNFETGGYMPNGFRAGDVRHPEYEQMYNVKELIAADYKPRTWTNVYHSDFTVRLAKNFNSAGEICTMRAIRIYNKHSFDIKVDHDGVPTLIKPIEFAQVLKNHKVKVLNVAGNANLSLEKGIEEFLSKTFFIISCMEDWS